MYAHRWIRKRGGEVSPLFLDDSDEVGESVIEPRSDAAGRVLVERPDTAGADRPEMVESREDPTNQSRVAANSAGDGERMITTSGSSRMSCSRL